MNPTPHRSTRDRPAKPPLSEEAVVDAALAILRADGLQAVSMRRVAAALDTGAGSLYVYVSGREGLLQAMLDRIIATIELEAPDPARWRDQLHSLLERMRRALDAHPGIATAAMANAPTTEAALLLQENLLGLALAGGLDPRDAAWAGDILTLLVNYAAIEADVRRADRVQLADRLYSRFVGLPPDRFPLLATHAALLVAGDGDERFSYGIDVVIDGLITRSARRSPVPVGSHQPRA